MRLSLRNTDGGELVIALHSVTTSNDLNVMSEQSVREFVEKSIVYTVEDKPAETETTTTGTAATTTATAFHDDTVNNPPVPESSGTSEISTTSATGTSGGNENSENPVFVAG